MKFEENLRELRKQQGYSQEELAEKLNVSRQAVSKWENGSGYPELDKIMTLCELFHCKMDDLLKGNVKERNVVSMERYDEHHNRMSVAIALGVFMVLSAFTSGAFLDHVFPSQEDAIIAIPFFIFITIGILIFIYFGLQSDSFHKKYPIDPLDLYTEEELETFEHRYRFAIVIGVGILLISFAVQQLLSYVFMENIANGVFFFMISIAITTFVYFGMQKKKYDQTLPKSEEALRKEEEETRSGKWCGIIMLMTTAIYLLWSFLTSAWNVTWIVWPIGGIGCGIVSILLKHDTNKY